MIDGTGRLYKKEVIRIVLPSVFTILLFVVTLFAIALPVFKNNLLAQKKALISAEVQTILSMLEHYEQLTASGKLSLKLGQKLAIPVEEQAMRRVKHTVPQIGLSPAERQAAGSSCGIWRVPGSSCLHWVGCSPRGNV